MFLINPNEFGRFITIAFNIFMVPMGFERKCSASDGRLGATYINEYVVEVYNFYALAPETYIAKMIGWVLMVWVFYIHCLQHIHGAGGFKCMCSAPDGWFRVNLRQFTCISSI